MDTPAPRRPTLAAFALGLFVVGQIAFLALANCLHLLAAIDPAARTCPVLGCSSDLCERWATLTNQPQRWSLFAPTVDTEVAFPAVELVGDHSSVLLLSVNEPDDLRSYFRVGGARLRRTETALCLPLSMCEGKEIDDVSVHWQTRVADHVRDGARPIRAYLRWRLTAYRREHPDMPEPREVRLLTRTYRLPGPGESFERWPPPYQIPLARWLPGEDRVETYNPITSAYDPVRP